MYGCKHLYKTINFHQTCIKSCSANGEGITLGHDVNDFFIEALEEKYAEAMRFFENGEFPEYCKNCFELKENYPLEEIQKKVKFETFYISNWFHCNADCTFCVHKYSTTEKAKNRVKKSSTYDVLPILKKFKENNLIGDHPKVYVTGGEPALLKELPEVIDFFIENNADFFQFYTSAIRYSEAIHKVLKSNIHSEAIISIDSGNKNLYKQIKRVDKFNEVVENIKKYSDCNEKNRVIVKYIIIQGVNDNKECLQEWLDLMNTIGIHDVRLDVDYNWDYSIKSNIYELFKYTKNAAEKLNMNIDITEMTEHNLNT